MSFLSAFTDLVLRFNDELIELYPNEIEFKTGKTAIQLIKKTNPRMLLQIFKTYIEPYREKVMNKDESFFMNKNYEEDTGSYQNILMLIGRLKEKWEDIGEDNQTAIWKYIQTLIILMDKC